VPETFRIATFNLENFDDQPGQRPTLEERIALMRPELIRLDADILCLQEVNAQKEGGTFVFRALDRLVEGTDYAVYGRAASNSADGVRNIVLLSRFPILDHELLLHTFVPPPSYRMVTADPPQDSARDIEWERPILHGRIQLTGTQELHVLVLHLKSKLPTDVPGQRVSPAPFSPWRSASGVAEGSFVSAMKRLGQSLETRVCIDRLFDQDAGALIAVCGDFNSDYAEVSLEAIRGDVEDSDNPDLASRVMVPCELSIPESARYSLFHHGRGQLLDHVVVSRSLLQFYRHTEIHNEVLHDESVAFATDITFPESDHAPVVAEFVLPG